MPTQMFDIGRLAGAMPLSMMASIMAIASHAAPAAATPRPRISVNASVHLDPSGLPTIIKGTARYQKGSKGGFRCLYLPFNNPHYGHNRGVQKQVDAMSGKASRLRFAGGSTTIAGIATGGQMAVPIPPSDEFELSFQSTLPRLPGESAQDFFFDGFYPLPTRHCGEPQTVVPVHLDVQIEIPTGWDAIGNGLVEDRVFRTKMTSRRMAILIAKDINRTSVKVGDRELDFYYRHRDFLDLVQPILQSFQKITRLIGPPPWARLVIVESPELQRQDLDGMIAINRPRQVALSTLQNDWMNWRQWMATQLVVKQWLGASIYAKDETVQWLIDGTAAFVTNETLRRLSDWYNLFNPSDSGKQWVSFDNLQIQEIQSAILRRSSPFLKLTDARQRSLVDPSIDHPLAHIRHTNALRQLSHQLRRGRFWHWLQNFCKRFRFQAVDAASFLSFLQSRDSGLSPTESDKISAGLQQWWQSEGWPDFALAETDSTPLADGRFQVDVTATQNGEIDYPPLLSVRDQNRKMYDRRAVAKGGKWHARFTIDHEVETIWVDRRHEAFDSDRFDNRSTIRGIRFFPGSANTLPDDSYTVIWAPYALRRPGEPVSVGTQGALFRYIHGSVFFKSEIAPAEKLGAFSIRRRYAWEQHALHGDATIDQIYDGDRSTELSLVRSPLFDFGPKIGIAVKGRYRQQVGRPKTGHYTGATSLSVKPWQVGGTCRYDLGTEIERAPPQTRPFAYERLSAKLSGGCSLFDISFDLRLFGGRATQLDQEPVPDTALFKPTDLAEARLRLDVRGLRRVDEIVTVGQDLSLPLWLPIPQSSLILARRVRARLFYDWGFAPKLDTEYRAAGAGIGLPLGGDLSGAGSIAFSQFSLLAVLFTKAGRESSRDVRVLFDFSGQL